MAKRKSEGKRKIKKNFRKIANKTKKINLIGNMGRGGIIL